MATRKIDTELSLTGEKEFNDQMKAVNNSLKTTRSEMAVVTAEFGKNSTKIKALTAEHKILKQTLEDQKAKEKALSDQLKAAEQAYGKNSAQAQKYRQELNQARAAVINTENALQANTKAMRTQNAAAKALGTTFSAVAKGALAVTKATGKMIAGSTVGALVAAGGAAVVAAKGFQQLGKFAVEAAQAKGDDGKPLYSQYAQLSENLEGLTTASGAAKAALGSLLLPALESLSTEGTQFLNDFSAAMAETGGDTEKMGAVVGDFLAAGVQQISEKLPQYLQMGGDILTALGGGIAANLDTILASAGEILQTLTDGLISAAPDIGAAAVDVVMFLVGFLIENAPELLTAVGEAVKALVQGFEEKAEDIVNIGKNAVENIKRGITNAWESLKAWFKGIWDSLFGNLHVNVGVSGSDDGTTHARTGLWRVPYDDFPAILHQGEAVLTAQQADKWRTSRGSGGGGGVVVNVYAQTLSEDEVDYLISRVNREFGEAI